MAKGNVTTVTHPDGTVSRRKSESRIYTHAVVISRSRQSLVADQLAAAEICHEQADKAREAISGEITEESRSWLDGKRYIDLCVGGEWAGAYVSDQVRPSDEELREKMRGRVRDSEKRAEQHLDKAAALRSAPEFDYEVLRWSSREDLAVKAAQGEFSSLVRPGVTVTVTAVD